MLMQPIDLSLRFSEIENAWIECQAMAEALVCLGDSPDAANAAEYLAQALKQKLDAMGSLFNRSEAEPKHVSTSVAAAKPTECGSRDEAHHAIYDEAVLLCGLMDAADQLLEGTSPSPRGASLHAVVSTGAERAQALRARIWELL